MTQSNIWIVWCAVPCIFLGVALSECQSAWTWDLHWLPAGQRWVLQASRPLYALSWPFSKKLETCCRCFHWDVTETFQGAPKVFQFLLFLILFSDKRPGGEEEEHTETQDNLLFTHHVLDKKKQKNQRSVQRCKTKPTHHICYCHTQLESDWSAVELHCGNADDMLCSQRQMFGL